MVGSSVLPTARVFLIAFLAASHPISLRAAEHCAAEQQPSRDSSTAGDGSGGYIQATLMMTLQPAGVAVHRVSPPIKGNTLGIATAAGVFVTPRLGIEGELAVGRTIAMPQRFSYFWTEDFTGQSRDVLLNANIRWRPGGTKYLELIGGGGLAISTFALRSIRVTDSFGRASTGREQITTSRRPALGGSIATPLPVSPIVEIVPAFGFRWVKRSEEGLAAHIGAGSYAYQLGASVRFKL